MWPMGEGPGEETKSAEPSGRCTLPVELVATVVGDGMSQVPEGKKERGGSRCRSTRIAPRECGVPAQQAGWGTGATYRINGSGLTSVDSALQETAEWLRVSS
jgi:hypothetical protein